MKLVAHVPLTGPMEVGDIEIEQDLSRPYAYVSRMRFFKGSRAPAGFQIIDLREPEKAKVLYTWFIGDPDQDLHEGSGLAGKYFKLKGRYYYAQGFQFRANGPDHDLGVVVFDVTGLPDTTKIREVGRIRIPDIPGGVHNLFAYKHSDGRTLLFTTVESNPTIPYGANIYDMEKFIAGDKDFGLVGHVPMPMDERGANRGYHDCFVQYDAATGQDRFYGGGPETTYLGGNYVYDVSDIANPKLLVTMHAQESQQSGGHTFVATPDGRYGFTVMTSPAHQPVRVFDLKPALDKNVPLIKVPIGEWTPDPKKSVHMIEVRWPYAFVASYEDGLQVVNIRDPANPRTIGYYDTYDEVVPYEGGGVANGAFGLDVRNADGLIVISDDYSGFWAFRMDGFNGWNGHNWGMPNASSVQDWDNGPDGAAKWKNRKPVS